MDITGMNTYMQHLGNMDKEHNAKECRDYSAHAMEIVMNAFITTGLCKGLAVGSVYGKGVSHHCCTFRKFTSITGLSALPGEHENQTIAV
jgi:hypothetical protein